MFCPKKENRVCGSCLGEFFEKDRKPKSRKFSRESPLRNRPHRFLTALKRRIIVDATVSAGVTFFSSRSASPTASLVFYKALSDFSPSHRLLPHPYAFFLISKTSNIVSGYPAISNARLLFDEMSVWFCGCAFDERCFELNSRARTSCV
ncbi:hypothetical protein PIB30_045418 [Stylosanthes scabra]|uniref:Uncharacterized protein n=1 Tax=Stylosanthes scabra TaxID=79078 RepID=A0ABU6ZEX8_9FABA|nr:hypothetical protein [Stylosanthes scabra]